MKTLIWRRIQQGFLLSVLAGTLAITSSYSSADETCQSPYMAKIEGQEDFVYVWTSYQALRLPGTKKNVDLLENGLNLYNFHFCFKQKS